MSEFEFGCPIDFSAGLLSKNNGYRLYLAKVPISSEIYKLIQKLNIDYEILWRAERDAQQASQQKPNTEATQSPVVEEKAKTTEPQANI